MLRLSLRKLNRWWSRTPISYRGGLILTIPAACIVVILVTWGQLRKDAIVVHREIDRSESTLVETNNLQQLLSSAETGVRGYIITKQLDFLEPYDRAIAQLPNCIEKLKKLQQNTAQQQNVREIAALVEQELVLLSQTIDRTQKRTTPSELNDILTQSKQKFREIRTLADALKSQEWQTLGARRQELFNIREVTNLAFGSAAIVSLLSFLAALYLFKLLERELNDRQQSLQLRAEELANLNRVLARTKDTLAERNLELDRFSYIVSHDLKAPLRGISNLAEWIEEDAEKLDEDTRKYLQLQRERVARMEKLIDGLLQYARIGRQKASIETVDVRQLLVEVIDSIDPTANFAIAIEGKMPIISTQRLFLEQVFGNLIGNAIKHHPRSDGKVTISAREHEGFYEFTVADDGAGIPPTAQKKIFEIFHTLNNAEDTNTGIGLAIVKKIVEDRGGKITVESRVGIGTTFRFQWIAKSDRQWQK